MAGWLPWLIVAFALGLGEALTGRAFLRPWAIGAAVAAIVDAAGAGSYVPWVVFVVGSTVARPLVAATRSAHAGGASVSRPLRSEPMVGKEGVVLEQIANRHGVGCIELEGEIWTARSFHRDRVIGAGARVTVVEVRGATALVTD
jgi:membrane protein implicated in regulation of membrane protease activity